MVFYLIQTNFVVFTILIFLYIFLLTNQTIEKSIVKRFLLAGVFVNILMVADMMDYYFASLLAPSMWRYITSATGYVLRPSVIISILLNPKEFRNASSKMQAKNAAAYERKFYAFIIVPFVINAIIAYSSYITHWMFYFDEHNLFHRGPLGLLPFILSGYYLLLVTSWAFRKFRIGDKRESAVILLVVLMAVVAVCMESIFHFKFIVNGVGATSLVFYYLFLHTQTFKRDALTHVLNRHSFYSDKERLRHIPMTIVSIDVNNLKQINDQTGHNEGDQAIRTVAEELMNKLERGAFLYRMGGDEFMMLCPKISPKDVSAIMTAAEKNIGKKGYSIAWGMAEYKPSMDMEKVISLSDEKMYEQKKRMKNALTEPCEQ